MSRRAIEVYFDVPVDLTRGEERALFAVVEAIAHRTAPPGCVHWLSGYGDKPLPALYTEGPGPRFDADVLSLSTCCREASAAELERPTRKPQPGGLGPRRLADLLSQLVSLGGGSGALHADQTLEQRIAEVTGVIVSAWEARSMLADDRPGPARLHDFGVDADTGRLEGTTLPVVTTSPGRRPSRLTEEDRRRLSTAAAGASPEVDWLLGLVQRLTGERVVAAAAPAVDESLRCPARDVLGDGSRCGNYAGHEGDHTRLIPTGAPWFPKDGGR